MRREQFTGALASGETRVRRHFALYYRPNGLSLARLGIIVGRRVAPRAVDRNRVKRMVREAFRNARLRLSGTDIVIQLRRAPARGADARLAAEIGLLLGELERLARST